MKRIVFLSSSALILIFLLTLPPGKNLTLDIGISEDILVNTAPDVAFHFKYIRWI